MGTTKVTKNTKVKSFFFVTSVFFVVYVISPRWNAFTCRNSSIP